MDVLTNNNRDLQEYHWDNNWRITLRCHQTRRAGRNSPNLWTLKWEETYQTEWGIFRAMFDYWRIRTDFFTCKRNQTQPRLGIPMVAKNPQKSKTYKGYVLQLSIRVLSDQLRKIVYFHELPIKNSYFPMLCEHYQRLFFQSKISMVVSSLASELSAYNLAFVNITRGYLFNQKLVWWLVHRLVNYQPIISPL